MYTTSNDTNLPGAGRDVRVFINIFHSDEYLAFKFIDFCFSDRLNAYSEVENDEVEKKCSDSVYVFKDLFRGRPLFGVGIFEWNLIVCRSERIMIFGSDILLRKRSVSTILCVDRKLDRHCSSQMSLIQT